MSAGKELRKDVHGFGYREPETGKYVMIASTRSVIVTGHRSTMPQDRREMNMTRPRTPEMLNREERQATSYTTLAGFGIAHCVKDVFDDRTQALVKSATHEPRYGSANGDGLTARELDVLAMISQGCSNKLVARVLEISPETVKTHVKRIFLKLAVNTRTEAVFRALSLDLL